MAEKHHHFEVRVRWTGNTGAGTTGYRSYERSHDVEADGKPPLPGSAAVAFRGDADRWNPEELLMAALSQCHMLSYLAVAVAAKVNVVDYTDTATGTMVTHADGSGEFTEVTLHPVVTVADPESADTARRLHRRASELCFIARSVNFPVHHEPVIRTAGAAAAP
ncbi:OsmC family protein [Marinitenerispora sediminis]|uniref:Peroxiredoxin n=1 Tax=Marinitenerispora sediminis TaxID=1931232 RepID=A0A368T8A5_9ACTN|nr:OsmC family protein [Marinitenerispora sediminis]RCV50625.1 peroxiredoxin [Marinitenerispora sediminis]RCV51315.1 peroxiredoxin [Marinitenerispora sediminis]RCV60441.1 peroxiredoxin [Marinitenerispora sediminis]